MKIDFIVITYKRKDLLKKTLESIKRTISNDKKNTSKIYLIDNESNIETKKIVNTLNQLNENNIIYLDPGSNLGVAGGREYGFQRSNAEIQVYIDDDALIKNEKDFISNIISFFNLKDNCAIIAFKCYSPSGKLRISDMPTKNFNSIHKVTSFIGVGHAINRKRIKFENLYPKIFKKYGMEETALSIRVISIGYDIFFLPNASVIHLKSSSGRSNIKEYHFYMAYNKIAISIYFLPIKYFLSHFILWSLWMLKKNINPLWNLKLIYEVFKNYKIIRRNAKIIDKKGIVQLKKYGKRITY